MTARREAEPPRPLIILYSKAQAYSILGTAPVQGHISGVVDIPNASGPVKMLDGSIDMPLSQDV